MITNALFEVEVEFVFEFFLRRCSNFLSLISDTIYLQPKLQISVLMRTLLTRDKRQNEKSNHVCIPILWMLLVLCPILLPANPENPKNLKLPEKTALNLSTEIGEGNTPLQKGKSPSSSYFSRILSVFDEKINGVIAPESTALLTFSCNNGLLANPEFESDFSDWDFFANSTITNDSHFGSKAAFTSGGSGGIGKNFTAFENEVFSMEIYAKTDESAGASVGIKFMDGGYNEIESVLYSVESNVYKNYEISAKAPAGTVYVQTMGWKNAGSGTATFDGVCFEKWTLEQPTCQGKSADILPSYNNYVWAMDDSGIGDNWKNYDTGGIILCDNEDGTFSFSGNLINGNNSDWDEDSEGIPCGSQDGWNMELTLYDKQSWTEFQGNYVQKVGCGANHIDWDYYQISGTLTGIGCNVNRTITILSSSTGYRAQVGWGGNSNSCDFGISTWMNASENGNDVQADLYAHIDEHTYKDIFPENCINGVDDDCDGLVDCYDPDCAPQILVNESFEDASSITFNTTFQGSPAVALPDNTTIVPNWEMDYSCGGSCFDSYWVNDVADVVNNPKGDYFIWLPGSSYCAKQSITVDMDKCYEITIVAAAFSDPSPQSRATFEIEAFGGGIEDNGGLLSLFEYELPASPNWNQLNWKTISFTWSPPVSATTNIFISQNNNSGTAKGIAFDQILIKEICCEGGGIDPEFTCADGKDIELQFAGIKNDVPKTIAITDISTIDSVIVEVVYKSGNPGPSITVEDDNSNSYTAYIQNVGSNAYVYKAVLPATSSVTYSNTGSVSNAQSLAAFIFRHSQEGKSIVREFTTIGGYNGTFTVDFEIPQDVTTRNIQLTLPISEITYDDRSLDFDISAGSSNWYRSVSWGPNGEGFDNGCCIDTVVFFLNDVAPEVDTISLDIISPGGGVGQSFVIAATIEIELFCEEICGNGIDDDGDGLVDNEDPECLCPEIWPADTVNIEICEGQAITFDVLSNAPNPPYTFIEFWRFDTQQANPYTSTDIKTWLGGFANTNNGAGSINNSNFPNDGMTDMTYYVYGCVKPSPPDPTTCTPLVEYIVTVKPGTVLSTSPDATICSNANTTISATGTGGPTPYIFNWSDGLGTGPSHTVNPSVTNAYNVTVTNSAGCSDNGQVLVTVNEAPVADAGAPTFVCIGLSTTLTASATGGTAPYSYNWDHGLGSGAVQTVSPNSTTIYGVTVTSDNGCVDNDQVTVTASACTENCINGIDDDGDGQIDCGDDDCQPVPTAGSDVNICVGTSTQISASVPGGSGSFTYVWSHGLGTGPDKTVSPAGSITYTVTVTNGAGCSGIASVTVTVNNCPEVCTDGIDNDGDGLIDCEDPDCFAVGAPSLQDDYFTTCPAAILNERVDLNDFNLQDPLYSVLSYPSQGLLSLDNEGKFTYTPFTDDCGNDLFVYEVCNQATGCCATAAVILTIGDTDPPVLHDVPEDITISCDETVPDPNVVLAFDNCPGIYVDFDENSDEYSSGGCEGYTITRFWNAEDLCGNMAADTQIITVVDLEAPELFQVYTLANGEKLMAGISQRGVTNWKYVAFPVHFTTTPLVFCQVVSSNDNAALSYQLRNVTNEGFEFNLTEQEAADQSHLPEQFAWMAILPGQVPGAFEADSAAAVNHTLTSLTLGQTFPTMPHLFFSVQTVNETDPFSVRMDNAVGNGTDVWLSEETSNDAETNHADEAMAYLAIAAGENLKDEEGDFVGETGQLNLTNAWASVTLNRSFSKPVVLFGGIGNNDPDPVTVRVRNVTATGFEVRLQEWDNQDGNHATENVSYIVIEGALPDDINTYCEFDNFKMQPGVNVFVRDNCDTQLALEYDELSNMMPDGLQIIRSWSAVDDCGNSLDFGRTDECRVASIRLHTLLYGALMDNLADTLMSDSLRKKGLLPVEEPYSDLAYIEHFGNGGGETVDPTAFDVIGENAIVDWILLEIRDSADAGEVIETKSVLVKRNGEIVSVDGEDILYFPNLQEGSYNVAFRHRNHLGIASQFPWYLSSVNIPTLDFTNVNTPIFQKGESATIINNMRAAWAGDFNGDRRIIYQGPDNDVFYLFSIVLGDPGNVAFLANYISFGYDRTDMDMDGRMIYQGPDNERAKLLYFTTLAHPANTGFLANYIVLERLP